MDENKNIILGSGISFEYPHSLINKILTNQEIEVGNVIGNIAKYLNLKNESVAISFLSRIIITRIEILSQL
jgi:non-canonical (house-cleaning) NTP pyrophosphatase